MHFARRSRVPFPKRHYTRLGELIADVRALLRRRADLHEALRAVPHHMRSRLMLAVTQVNGCRYCAYYHTQVALRGGMSPAEIASVLSGELAQAPADEQTALLYAQHWAETRGQPDPAARASLVQQYGPTRALQIEVLLQAIMLGNYAGNSFDALLYRLSGGRWPKAPRCA